MHVSRRPIGNATSVILKLIDSILSNEEDRFPFNQKGVQNSILLPQIKHQIDIWVCFFVGIHRIPVCQTLKRKKERNL